MHSQKFACITLLFKYIVLSFEINQPKVLSGNFKKFALKKTDKNEFTDIPSYVQLLCVLNI